MKSVIELAKEAGLNMPDRRNDLWMPQLERFAALVAAHERNKYLDKLAEAIDLSVKAEREACAKLALTAQSERMQSIREAIAAAIRARGEK